MEKIIKLNSQTAGRDKIARLLQYLSKVIWYKLQGRNRDGVDAFKNLEFQLSTFRKLLRFGKCIDVIYSILPLLKYNDHTVKVTVILGRLSNAIFLLADHILWLGRTDLCIVDTDKWGRLCSQYWLYSLCMNLIRDLYEILHILRTHKEKIVPLNGVNNFSDILKVSSTAFLCIQQHPHVMADVIKNVCDIFLPLAALGYFKLSPSILGTFGVVSSITGIIVLLNPSCKLSP